MLRLKPVFFFLFFVYTLRAVSQEYNLLENNFLQFGFDKIYGTYIFAGLGNIKLDNELGQFNLLQNYRSTILKTPSQSFRDDQSLSFLYKYRLSNLFYFFSNNSWLLSSDSRSIGLNKLENLLGTVGSGLNFGNNSYFEINGGFERNTQLNISSGGPSFGLSGNLEKIEVLDLIMNSNLKGKYSSLNPDRKNADLNFILGLMKEYDQENRINASLDYKIMNRDFVYYPVNITDRYYIEQREEQRISSALESDFLISGKLFGSMRINLNSLKVSRAYNDSISNFSLSYFYRNLNELILTFNPEIKFASERYIHRAGFKYDLRNEDNFISKKFNISEAIEDELQNNESQRDNNSTKSGLYSFFTFLVSSYDTLSFNVNTSLLQFDTPSTTNYDDRDEFNAIFDLKYSKRFSEVLTASATLNLQLNHLVYIKAQRSALNNWNRVIKFNPEINYRSSFLSANPSFEILANYTVYDFEDIAPGIKSYSFRQIAYKDSLLIPLFKNIRLNSRINIRYFERGILFWKKFAESPQSNNLEQYYRLMIFYNPSIGNIIGCGLSFFNLKTGVLKSDSKAFSDDYNQQSISLESEIGMNFISGSFISFRGWLEFQEINYKIKKVFPNFFILVKYFFG
ncbi:MAG: hypothetical protein N2319_08245 [Candidatus Kapabacteria bacterium]|nr:hypothetical protein [Candidatus Kapabacteria bacterium]